MWSNDEGGITVLVVAALLILLSLFSAISFVINGFSTAQRLNNSADRVALAAATKLFNQPNNVCAVANELAERNEVQLDSCEVKDDEVTVRVTSVKDIQKWLDRWRTIGMARAGIDYAYD